MFQNQIVSLSPSGTDQSIVLVPPMLWAKGVVLANDQKKKKKSLQTLVIISKGRNSVTWLSHDHNCCLSLKVPGLKRHKKENSQIKAAEAKVSWILIPCMGQAPKNMDSYISHNATLNAMLTLPEKYQHHLNFKRL